MAEEFRLVHGFYLNVAGSARKPTIFLLPVFPESVVEVKPNKDGGNSITVRTAKDETITLDVTQDTEFVRDAMRRCADLDKEGPPRASQ